ncbi:hypothetical protein SCLCIDRAFT_1100532 [Scleroderma citrinum Foug A]|uniref:Uncharacterized protein n=1 Tax=Scleroderma citrinum Foug A TaxID=1036808 RepID=A0A0C3DPK3_9AGAM|nr:hypothetical protein SCLCIDRAFT_1100532 [Scleroderma citrinum Foug A]
MSGAHCTSGSWASTRDMPSWRFDFAQSAGFDQQPSHAIQSDDVLIIATPSIHWHVLDSLCLHAPEKMSSPGFTRMCGCFLQIAGVRFCDSHLLMIHTPGVSLVCALVFIKLLRANSNLPTVLRLCTARSPSNLNASLH